MKIKFVFKFLPAFVSYVDDLDSGGKANGPFVRIQKKYLDDIGLLEHELVHVKQWYRTFGLHSLLYKFVEDYRLRSEIEAYKEQLKHYSVDLRTKFATSIATEYNINISIKEVLDEL